MANPSAARRARRPGTRLRPAEGVADPSRGTRVAIGIPLVAAAATVSLGRPRRDARSTRLADRRCLLVAGCSAPSTIVVQLGPRSWYTASTPVDRARRPPRRPAPRCRRRRLDADGSTRGRLAPRSAEGGVAALQGLAAGHRRARLLADAATDGGAAAAMVAAVAVNTRRPLPDHARATNPRAPRRALAPRGAGRPPRDRSRRPPALGAPDRRGAERSRSSSRRWPRFSPSLLLAQRSRATTAAALAAEQANARRDQLTGAPNRRAFEEAMAAEHARVVRGAVPAGCSSSTSTASSRSTTASATRVGDEVLIEVVRRLTRGPAALRRRRPLGRRGDHRARPGRPGHAGSSSSSASASGRSSASSRSPPRRRPSPVTVSVGGTLLDGSVPPATALHRADGALYEAKRTRDASAVDAAAAADAAARDRLAGPADPSRSANASALRRAVRSGQRRHDPEPDEDRARDVALHLRPARLLRSVSPAEPAASAHDRVRHEAEQHEREPEHEDLQPGVPERPDRRTAAGRRGRTAPSSD